MSHKLTTIVGHINRKKFEKDGWTVATLQPESEAAKDGSEIVKATGQATIVITGNLSKFEVGDKVLLRGHWDRHPRFGDQFLVSTALAGDSCLLESEEARKKEGWIFFLSKFPHIKRTRSKKLIEAIGVSDLREVFIKEGSDALKSFLEDPRVTDSDLKTGLKRAIDATSKPYPKEGIKDTIDTYVFIGGFGLFSDEQFFLLAYDSLHNLKKIDQIKDQLTENPYRILTLPGRDFDFETVDMFASFFGIVGCHSRRIEAGAHECAKRDQNRGHTCSEKGSMLSNMASLLDLSVQDIKSNWSDHPNLIVEETRAGKTYIYTKDMYETECYVAEELAIRSRIYCKPLELAADIDLSALSDQQFEAVDRIARENLFILTGGPGTGKTTTVKTIIEILLACQLRVACCAPTGKAAARMAEATGYEATTIHRFLDIFPGVSKLERHKVEADAIIIDETSMLDINLMAEILKLTKKETRLIFVGDVNQLPSVGPGTVLSDMLKSELPCVRLTEIFRQAAESKIIQNAHCLVKKYNLASPIKTNAKPETDFNVLALKKELRTPESFADMLVEKVTEAYGLSLADIQVIAPTKKYPLGVYNLNKVLKERINPFDETGRKKEVSHEIIGLDEEGRETRINIQGKEGFCWLNGLRASKGDPVIQTRNDYEKAVFNGEIGKILKVIRTDPNDTKKGLVLVRFEGHDKTISFVDGESNSLELAYALTVHKVQGSQFKCVIVVLDDQQNFANIPILYTAITRAQKRAILFGASSTIAATLKKRTGQPRIGYLLSRIRAAINKYDQPKNDQLMLEPTLPASGI